MKVIKVMAMVVVMTAFASCGVLKNKHKESNKLEVVQGVKIEKKVEESSSSKVEVKEREQDKGTIVTERSATTTTTTEGGKGKLVIKKGDLKPGENFLRDSAGPLVKAILDTLNKTLTLEIEQPSTTTQTVTNEKITESKDATKERQEERQDTTTKQVAVTVDSTRREVQQSGVSDSKPNVWAVLMNNIGWGIALLIIVLGVLWWFFGFRRNR